MFDRQEVKMASELDKVAKEIQEQMWSGYSDIAIDHAQNPKNVGKMENADAHSSVLGPCGDTMEFWLRIKDKKVENATFWTDGCGSSIVCGSMTTELVIGKTLKEVFNITPEVILKSLGGLPQDSVHCAELASNTLEKALTDYLKSNETSPFNLLASKYDAWFDGEGKLIFATEVKAFQKVLPSLPRPWLEVGVGSGRFAQALGIERGIDPSVKLLEMAKKRGIVGFPARGEDLPFKEGSFGTVFLIVTLCFVNSPQNVLRENHRILRLGGNLVLGFVLRDSLWGQFYLAKKREGHDFYRHASFYSNDEVTKLLEQAGFTITEVVSTLFQKPGEVKRVEAPHQGFSANAGFTVMVAEKSAGQQRK